MATTVRCRPITIDAGKTTGTGTVTTTEDADRDDETFTVSLGDLPSSVTPGSPNSVTVTITDATPPPSSDATLRGLTIDDLVLPDAAGGAPPYAYRLTGPDGAPLPAGLAFHGGGAHAVGRAGRDRLDGPDLHGDRPLGSAGQRGADVAVTVSAVRAPMASAWLARFARTATDYAVDALKLGSPTTVAAVPTRCSRVCRCGGARAVRRRPRWGSAAAPAAWSAARGPRAATAPVPGSTLAEPGSTHSRWRSAACGPRGATAPVRRRRSRSPRLPDGERDVGAGRGGGVTGMHFAGLDAPGMNGPGAVGMNFAGPGAPGVNVPGAGAGPGRSCRRGLGAAGAPGTGCDAGPLDLLLGSSFRLSSQGDSGGGRGGGAGRRPRLAAWGHAAGSFFNGADDGAALKGEVATWVAGVDAGWGRWLAGVAVAHSRGGGSHGDGGSLGAGAGEFSGTLTAVHPS